jgi:CheY-like chemotaxis protein
MDTNQKKILIAEDDQPTRDALTHKLSEENYNVIVAKNGQECLKILETEIPDLILLDLLMPIVDGYHVIKEIKKNEKIQNVPIVILTNTDGEKELSEIMEAKTFDYLLKVDHTLENIVTFIKNKLG